MRFVLMFVLLTTASETGAEVCDRSEFRLHDYIEGDEPITRERIDFSFESGVIRHRDGARETVYCILNNHDEFPVYVKWHGPDPQNLFVDYAAAGQLWTAKAKKRYEDTDAGGRRIEFGTSPNYGDEEEIDTLFFASGPVGQSGALGSAPIPVQATPLDLVGMSLPDALQDPSALDDFLEAYRASPEGGEELLIFSYSAGWLPADIDALTQLAEGETLEGYDGPYIPVSYGLRSALDIETRLATSTLRFWLGHFGVDREALSLAQEFGTLDSLELLFLPGGFEDISQLDEGKPFVLADQVFEAGEAQQVINQAGFADGQTGAIVPFAVGIGFEGQPFSAIHAEIIAN
ncbi:hypothetical protein [Roseovarius sp.]|uniref:hypothetical protein n=1 Tax=Roseovarius sp. TaxID=1486281 RepID=UPI003BA85C20